MLRLLTLFPRRDPLRLVLLASSALLALVTSSMLGLDWYYDSARAVDRGGLYLFLASPLYAGMACLLTMQWRRSWDSFSLPAPIRGLTAGTPWLWIAGQGVAFHVVVVVTLWVVAKAHTAIGHPDLLSTAVQFLSILGFSALGGIVGRFARSELAAVSLGGGILVLNVAFPSLYFRVISDVGTGDSDLALRPYATEPLALKAVVFTGLIIAGIPIRRIPAWARKIVSLLGLSMTLGAVIGLYNYTGPRTIPVAPSSANWSCFDEQDVEVCGPHVMYGLFGEMAESAGSAVAVLADVGVKAPRRAVIATDPREASISTVMLELGPTEVRRGQSLQAVIYAYTAAPHCDVGEGPSSVPDESVLLARAALYGWLQYRLDSVVEGSFPSVVVENIRKLPSAAQALEIRRLYTMTQSCSGSIPLQQLAQ